MNSFKVMRLEQCLQNIKMIIPDDESDEDGGDVS
jgi:hypothetical protein